VKNENSSSLPAGQNVATNHIACNSSKLEAGTEKYFEDIEQAKPNLITLEKIKQVYAASAGKIAYPSRNIM